MMTDFCLRLLVRHGFRVNVDECAWGTPRSAKSSSTCYNTPDMSYETGAGTSEIVHVHNRLSQLLTNQARAGNETLTIKRTPPNAPVQVLSSQLAMNSDAIYEIAYRISRAWATFSKSKGTLTSRAGSLRQRFGALWNLALPCLLYGSGMMNFTQKHLQRHCAVEIK